MSMETGFRTSASNSVTTGTHSHLTSFRWGQIKSWLTHPGTMLQASTSWRGSLTVRSSAQAPRMAWVGVGELTTLSPPLIGSAGSSSAAQWDRATMATSLIAGCGADFAYMRRTDGTTAPF